MRFCPFSRSSLPLSAKSPRYVGPRHFKKSSSVILFPAVVVVIVVGGQYAVYGMREVGWILPANKIRASDLFSLETTTKIS